METHVAKRKCPKCDRGNLDYRTPRAFWIKTFLFWLPIRRYKCGYCDKKSYVYGAAKSANSTETKLGIVKPDTED